MSERSDSSPFENSGSPPATRIPFLRVILFFACWLAMAGTGKPEVAVGIVAVGLATWLSLKLMPARGGRLRPVPLLRLGLRFLRDSLVAGVEVAMIALRPNGRLKPGVVEFPSRLPQGAPRAFFNSFTSLMPGTLAVEPAENGQPQFHCLDTDKPVVEEMKVHEALVLRCLGEEGARDG
jgi:multicomponent Na+:H+ antiporter subunit E